MLLGITLVAQAQDGPATLSGGGEHTCALRPEGSVICWGRDSSGQATPRNGRFIRLSAGFEHTCGLRPDGRMECWGDNSYKQATPPDGSFTEVSAGDFHTCGLRPDGRVECWGGNVFGQATPPDDQFTQLSAGSQHTCGLRPDSSVVCWGSNWLFYRQASSPAGSFTQVTVGQAHSCGRHADGSVACWGSNFFGQGRPPPGPFIQISAGRHHMCGLRPDGRVECWGNNIYGQAAPPKGGFIQVTAGDYHTCALGPEGRVECWGNNIYGQATPPGDNLGPAQVTTSTSEADQTRNVKSFEDVSSKYQPGPGDKVHVQVYDGKQELSLETKLKATPPADNLGPAQVTTSTSEADQTRNVRSFEDVSSKYQLGPGDKVHVQVYGEQELSLETKLTDAGTILYPFLGEIRVADLTIGQLADLITRGLKGDYLVDPKVSVSILKYREFFINGEVAKPGAYPYQPGLTVQKAVSLAGGFSERASRSSITIIRDKDPTHTPQDAILGTPVAPGDVLTVEESFF